MAIQALLLLLLLLLTTVLLIPLTISLESKTYIVRVQNNLKPSIFPDIESWYSATLKTLSPTVDLEGKQRNSFLHVYKTVFHGYSTTLTDTEAELLRRRPGVLAVIPDTTRHLHTTRSPLFLGLVYTNSKPHNLLTGSNFGANIVIAVLDTGINARHRSFKDDGLGPVPPRWNGTCESGSDPSFPITSCNRKLVGARFFAGGFMSGAGGRPNITDTLSPRDTDGHGTHTASTAAGRPTIRASMLGYATGVASGMAPKACIAAYKVCWSTGCYDSDILAGMDSAVQDGADIISLSVGAGPAPYHLDPIAIGSFGAMERNVIVVTSAGNDGPGEMTVTNVSPWLTTVGAGTIDRSFPSDVVLNDGTVFIGTSLYSGEASAASLPLIYAGNASTTKLGYRSAAPFCIRGSLDPDLAKGKIVLCERGANGRVEKSLAVEEAGGAGIIIANQFSDGEGVVPDSHFIPGVAVGYTDGNAIHAYISSTADPRATLRFRGTELGVRPAPQVASFSSRGPNAQSLYIIKPDMVAPGVSILAGWTDSLGPTGLPFDTRRTEFNIVSGTSMSCPHVSGIAALLRSVHPDWSPAMVRSAMMTTAYVEDSMKQELLDESSGNKSTVFAMGSGHVDPERAVDPGLVYDLTADDYVGFLCGSNYTEQEIRTITRRAVACERVKNVWDFNYPSISVVLEQAVAGRMETVVRRTVTSVAEEMTVWTASVKEPFGTTMKVEPAKLVFGGKGEKQWFVVRISAVAVNLPAGNSKTEFGAVIWRDGKRVVRSPVAVTWQQRF